MKKKYELPKEFATKWVEALRSGEYKQAKGILKNNNSYCCLGVGCIIAGATPNQVGSMAYIPKATGINIPNELKGLAGENALVYRLTEMNDSGNLTFPEIAYWIEQNIDFV